MPAYVVAPRGPGGEPILNEKPVTPEASTLAPLSKEDPLGPAQWRTLMAIADTVVPTIKPASQAKEYRELGLPEDEYARVLARLEKECLHSNNKDLARQYLEERPSENPMFKELIWRYVSLNLPEDQKQLLRMSLNLLNSRVGALFMDGYPRAFANETVANRQKILQSWSTAKLPLIRLLYKSITFLIKQNWAKSSPTLGSVLTFPRTPVHGVKGEGFPYEFLQIPAGNDIEVIETDIVIVGSGCGAAVCAKNLSEAGHRVMVVDRSYHWAPEHLPMTEAEGFQQMFVSGGGMFSEDSSTIVVAGQAWGGGGTINWSACLQTQGYVRKEWAATGLPFFTTAEFQTCLDTACDRMGASATALTHNPGNDVLLEGARRLGWSAKPVPQNTGGKQHYCGYCTLGCGSCEKQGPAVSYLPDAARAGCKFIEGFTASKVLFADKAREGKQVATGIRGYWSSRDDKGGVAGEPIVTRQVQINAKRVIVSCGTMQSPLLLKRSGLKNKHIGRHLKLHPVSFVGATYDDEIRPWEGGILTAVINEFENLDGKGHGPKLEAVTMLPSIWLTPNVWNNAVDYKVDFAPRMKNMVGHFALQRDTTEGEVYPDPKDGSTRFRYTVNKLDRQHLMEGIIGCAKINYICGAREIFVTMPGVPRFIRSPRSSHQEMDTCETDGVNCPNFNAWLDLVRKTGFKDPDCIFMSAHQMGTNRMAANAGKGVVDATGHVFGTEGLLVADASVFPSASGANPMVTNMGISEWISRNLVKEMKSPVDMVSKL